MITADDLAANALERFYNGVDDNNGVDVTFDNAVNARAYNAASGVTTSATSIDFANFTLRAKKLYKTPLHPLTYQFLFYVLPKSWA
jgi:hypothetical protein